MNKTPEISIIMSVYNGGKYLRESIDSILNQTFNNFELILVDDKSTDNTKQIIETYKDRRIKVIENNKNIGLTKSLNKAIKQSKGKYIARMDADDISHQDRLKEQYNFMEKSPDISIAGSFMNIINESGEIISINKIYTSFKVIKFVLLFKNCILHSSIIARSKDLKKIGFYNEKYKYTQDLDLYSRAINKNLKIAIIPKVLVSSRIHKETISKRPESNKLQKINRQKICLENINKYITSSNKEKIILGNAIWNQKITSIKNLLIAYKIIRKLRKKFTEKELPNHKEIKQINYEYKKRTSGFLSFYLKNTHPIIYTLIKKFK